MARSRPFRRRPSRRPGRPARRVLRRTAPPELPLPARESDPRLVADPRIAALLEEISQLRLSAATHLTVAAAAMDAGRPDIATELIEAQQRDVAALRLRAEELLHVRGETAEQARRTVASAAVLEESALLEAARTATTRRLRKGNDAESSTIAVLPRRAEPARSSSPWSATGALLAVAAAAVVALAHPFAPQPSAPTPAQISASVVASLDANVTRSYDELQQTAEHSSQVDVVRATARLHADLIRLLPMAATDPSAARRMLDVLAAERRLLTERAPSALTMFTADATRIVTQLRTMASPAVLAILPPLNSIVPPPATVAEAAPPAAPAAGAAPAPPAPGSNGDAGGSAGSSGSAGGAGGGSSTGSGDSAGGTSSSAGSEPVAPAPVVVLPDPAQPAPVAPPAVDGTGSTSGNGGTAGSGSTVGSGSGESSNTSGSDPTSTAPTAPQLPAPPVANTTAN